MFGDKSLQVYRAISIPTTQYEWGNVVDVGKTDSHLYHPEYKFRNSKRIQTRSSRFIKKLWRVAH